MTQNPTSDPSSEDVQSFGSGDGMTGSDAEGPADSGAGAPAVPDEHDGGADGGADGSTERADDSEVSAAEGPADSGAETAMPGQHDGGADGGADGSQ